MTVNETAETYTARILSFLGGREPLPILSSTAARLRQLKEGRTREELSRTPDPAHWSVGQILAHLADSEIVGAWRLRSILASDGITLQPFDPDTWSETFRYVDADPHESVELFATNRAATLALLRRVDQGLHANHGLHAERGEESVEYLVRLYAGHDLNHVAQIERLLDVSGSV